MPGLLGTSLNTDDILETLRGIGRGLNFGGTSGMIGAPVDMATAVLNNPGLLHHGLLGVQGLGIKDPVGGSKWIEQKLQNLGLLPQRQGNWQEGVGELASTFINPMTAAAVAGPKLYAAEQRAIENAMAPTTLNKQAGAIVWHGSPHKFDKFDSSKIGTGEGAQAYGHGLYLAEKQGVAQEYADALGKEVLIKGKPAYQAKTGAQAADLPVSNAAAGHLRMNDWDLQKALKMAEDDFIETGDQWFAKVHKELSTLAPNDITVNRGQMYKVDLPDDAIAKMLDWDKPLSKQAPGVLEAFTKSDARYGPLNGRASILDPTSPIDGQTAYRDLTNALVDSQVRRGSTGAADKISADYLRQLGIPGIRYLDGGSRGAGSGTSNFVVFPGNEDLLRILERNGQPVGLLGM